MDLRRAVDWLADLGLDAGGELAPLGGSTAASLVADARVVVKVYDRPSVEPPGERVANEVRGLSAAAASGIRAPRVIAADPGGSRLGAPAIVMTRLRGAPLPAPIGMLVESWIAGIAAELCAIATAPPPGIDLPHATSWREPLDSPPDWVDDERLWDAVRSRLDEGLHGSSPQFVHRDFHPMNVLWDGGAVSGIVDWEDACLGPIEFDVSRCRVNIAVAAGVDAADDFIRECGGVAADYDLAWDLETIVTFLGDVDILAVGNAAGGTLTGAGIRETFLELIRRAVRD